VLQHPAHAEALGRTLAERTRLLGPTVALSPALGGVIIGHEVARALGVRALFVEREQDELTLRRGFCVAPEDRVLIVEDVVTTGGSTCGTMRVAETAGARVVGAAAIINRVGDHAFNVPFETLANVSLPTYEPSSCPLCAERSPFVKPGSR
jgi:orotate phosphoribosyltransferase